MQTNKFRKLSIYYVSKIDLSLCKWPLSIGVKEETSSGSNKKKETKKLRQIFKRHDIALTVLKRVDPLEF
jgi:hypothetical protein